MIDLLGIQSRFNHVSCPLCGRSELDVRLRCDLGFGERLATAACRSCGSSYEASAELAKEKKSGRENAAIAVPEKLVRERGEVKAKLGDEEIVFKFKEGIRAFGKDGGEMPGTSAYWFAWFAFHPDTELAQASP